MNRYDQKMQELESEFSCAHMGYSSLPVTEEDIEKIETALQERLPADYREFVRDYGHYRQSAWCPFDNPSGIDSGGVADFFGIVGEQNQDAKNTCGLTDIVGSYRNLYGHENWPEQWLPIANGDGSDFYVMEFKGPNKGAIHYIVDAGLDERFKIADSFDEFIQRVKPVVYDEM